MFHVMAFLGWIKSSADAQKNSNEKTYKVSNKRSEMKIWPPFDWHRANYFLPNKSRIVRKVEEK